MGRRAYVRPILMIVAFVVLGGVVAFALRRSGLVDSETSDAIWYGFSVFGVASAVMRGKH